MVSLVLSHSLRETLLLSLSLPPLPPSPAKVEVGADSVFSGGCRGRQGGVYTVRTHG